MKKIIALGASNSKASINKKFAEWVAQRLGGTMLEVLDLNDYKMPVYSPDLEEEKGIPAVVNELKSKLSTADGFVISLAEYNGNYTVAFKNTQDWLSRIDGNIWGNKPTFLMAASPGKMGGKSVLGIGTQSFPHMGASVVATFSLPEFHKNFIDAKGLVNTNLSAEFIIQLTKFKNELKKVLIT
ncbi:NADPH-dependent FMN reductase [Maribacter sp. 2308TA10-17]|uniref:NADPH-dependent FMN reductase n=1 Tax=Maribacter sp. 2308TA10-17 TaxID=3386276 RepID=UPI0039BD32F8